MTLGLGLGLGHGPKWVLIFEGGPGQEQIDEAFG